MFNPKQLMTVLIATITFQSHAELVQPLSIISSEKQNLAASVIQKTEHKLIKSEDSKYSVNQSDNESVLDRLTAVASNTVKNFSQHGVASWYGRQFHGQKTANGETFNMNDLTAAHKTLPLNCMIRVTNKTNGKSVVVKVNDRGPFHGDRVVDLSYGAAKALGILDKGSAKVSIERIDD